MRYKTTGLHSCTPCFNKMSWTSVTHCNVNWNTTCVCVSVGSCHSINSTDYTCSCLMGYYGDGCAFFNPCNSSEPPCQNAGLCKRWAVILSTGECKTLVLCCIYKISTRTHIIWNSTFFVPPACFGNYLTMCVDPLGPVAVASYTDNCCVILYTLSDMFRNLHYNDSQWSEG
jgi:hypothetical protein